MPTGAAISEEFQTKLDHLPDRAGVYLMKNARDEILYIGKASVLEIVHLAFEVDNLDDTIRALNDKQIKITDGPTRTSSGSRFIFIDAPDGYEIELIERPPGTAIV